MLNAAKSTYDSAVFEFYGKADTVDTGKFLVNRVRWTTIDGPKAKIVEPTVPGHGITGIYIDSLWKVWLWY